MPVKPMNSITYRITGLMFLAVALTVFLLIYLMNVQMTEQFTEYLIVQQMEAGQHGMMKHTPNPMMMVMGSLEETFLASVHQSLIWVGMAVLVAGLAASYALARSITVPLRNLSSAAEQIEQGNFNQKVPIETKDEVGHLAAIFNRMAETLTINTNLRRQFLANIAHELRTPLSIIQGHLEGMVDGVIDPSKEQLASLHEEAIRLNRLITDLRDLSLAEVRQLAMEKSRIDINQIISRSVYMLKPLSDEKEISVSCLLAQDLPEIEADADRISQVFYNIFVNAIRYSPIKGSVKIITEKSEAAGRSWIKISVADKGPGIDQEDIPYLFDHFYRGDKSRDRKSGGSGLGLAVVKQLVEIHGGKVAVSSQLGEGSVFEILLPIELEEESKHYT
ncbi:two-component system, OmpR family, sensor histidine kinase BaeS [Pelosinus fermentans]|uniref:histidine kinase n=2 Tax=Sporomusaceae TaxID=1843490 RepID=I8RBA1_9FIRM|nr:ATP-binding region ATPase domain protein [Pelosinus fermentans B4]EIW22741.1 integral membrane sensor signal transduction histidine kinase [Pelosinus fermentans A11]OAM95585.1 integral membrane sensor signal transduction histidine kinase [Pelosinus fermentans DSM 17108]SDR30160.1 two-component system, OmpR family, sensor histidine kinase BaeS [Pelosinus fermentans]